MRKEPIPSGEVVDVCDCGVFADYFDGDPRELSKLFHLPPPILKRGAANDADGNVHTCAGCGESMELLRYEGGPFLHRCHSCASVFMTPAMLKVLRRYEVEAQPKEKRSLLGRLAHWLDSY